MVMLGDTYPIQTQVPQQDAKVRAWLLYSLHGSSQSIEFRSLLFPGYFLRYTFLKVYSFCWLFI